MMNLYVGYICKAEETGKYDVFVDGQTWGMLVNELEVESGWYVVKVHSMIKDKAGNSRSIYAVVGEKLDDTVVKDLIEIGLKSNTGLKLIVNKYDKLIPRRTKDDTRFRTLVELLRLKDDFDISCIDVPEMQKFILKLCSIIKERILGDMSDSIHRKSKRKDIDVSAASKL